MAVFQAGCGSAVGLTIDSAAIQLFGFPSELEYSVFVVSLVASGVGVIFNVINFQTWIKSLTPGELTPGEQPTTN